MAFEAAALKKAGVDYAAVPPRYKTPYFSHIMGGYSAGYYAYIWSEVLDANTVQWIKSHGGLTRENGDHFRKTLLSQGGSQDALKLFGDFAGHAPKIQPLLERRGLDTPLADDSKAPDAAAPGRARASKPRRTPGREAGRREANETARSNPGGFSLGARWINAPTQALGPLFDKKRMIVHSLFVTGRDRPFSIPDRALPMRKSPLRLVLLPLALSVALAACSSGDAAPAQQPVGAVTVVTLQSQAVTLTRELPGRTTPFLVAEVRPQVNGIVKRRLFTEGGLVTAGQSLYQIDDASYRADHATARANLARAQATLVSARQTAEAHRRTGQDRSRQPAGQRQRHGRAARGRGRGEGGAGRGRRHRRGPRLRPHHRADQRPHRQVVGHPGRAGHRQPGRAAGDDAAARSDLRRPHPVQQRTAGTAQGTRRRHARQHRGTASDDPARRRHPVLAPRASSPSPKSPSTRPPAASRCAWWWTTPTTSCCPACTCARRSATACARTRSWYRSKASPAIPRATPPRWWSATTARSRFARSRSAARSATSGWSRAAWPPATR